MFNAAELLAASGPSPWQTHYMFSLQSVGQVKWFIEWLSQYIALGRLSPWKPPVIPTSLVCLMDHFGHGKGCRLCLKGQQLLSYVSHFIFKSLFFTLLGSGLCSSCQTSFSNFFLRTDACWLMSMVEVISWWENSVISVCFQIRPIKNYNPWNDTI